jgi:myo-inositol-1(or 4)-monophosphatase
MVHRIGRKSPVLPAADSERLQFGIDIAVRAGTTAMAYYNSVLSENRTLTERKNAATLADEAAQRQAISAILGHSSFGKESIIAEEGVYAHGEVANEGYTWIIDPLDGTANFRRRIPFFCSAIAVLRNGRPHIGVVYDPTENEVFYAVDGHPARVWSIRSGTRPEIHSDWETNELKRCVFGTHISGRDEVRRRLFERGFLLSLSQAVENLRALGSGHLALAYVASGRLQGFLQLGSPLWDQAAGAIIVRNAGGHVHDLTNGREWQPRIGAGDFFAAANDSVNRQIEELIVRIRSDKADTNAA